MLMALVPGAVAPGPLRSPMTESPKRMSAVGSCSGNGEDPQIVWLLLLGHAELEDGHEPGCPGGLAFWT